MRNAMTMTWIAALATSAVALAACSSGTSSGAGGPGGAPGDGTDSGSSSSGGGTTGGAWTLTDGSNAADRVEDVAFGYTVSVDLTAGTFAYADPLTLDRRTASLPSSGSTAVALDADAARAATVTFTKDPYGLTVASITPDGASLKLVLTGTYAGSITLDSNKKLALSLAGVIIASPDGPAINVQTARRTFVILEDGTTNTLSDGGSASAAWSARTLADGTAMDLKGTFFAEGPLVFSGGDAGTGTLTITGVRKHALCSDAHVRVRSGRLTIAATGLTTLDAKDGIHARDAFVLDGGTVAVTSRYGDGVQVEGNEDVTTPLGFVAINGGTLTVVSYDHGVRASFDPADTAAVETAATADDPDPFVVINGGTVQVTSTGAGADAIRAGSSLTVNGGTITAKTGSGTAKGFQCASALTINDGAITIDTSGSRGEGMKSTLGSATVNGGTIAITSGEDGIAAETGLTITGGSIYIKSGSGDTDGLDSNGVMRIAGGLLVVDGSPNSPGDALDSNSGITLAGGTFFALGGAPPGGGGGPPGGGGAPPGGRAASETASATVPAVMLTVASSTWASSFSGKTLLVGTTSAAPLLAFELPAETTTGMIIYFRHPGLVPGTTYSLYTGTGAVSGAGFHGLSYETPLPAAGTTWTSVGSFTATSTLASKSL